MTYGYYRAGVTMCHSLFPFRPPSGKVAATTVLQLLAILLQSAAKRPDLEPRPVAWIQVPRNPVFWFQIYIHISGSEVDNFLVKWLACWCRCTCPVTEWNSNYTGKKKSNSQETATSYRDQFGASSALLKEVTSEDKIAYKHRVRSDRLWQCRKYRRNWLGSWKQ
jgi:hypothetical protein